MKINAAHLYTVQVFGRGGLTGSFFVAAQDLAQAKAMGEQWASENGIERARIEARKRPSAKTIFFLST